MYSHIKTYCDQLTKEFDLIPESRKIVLSKLADYIQAKRTQKLPVQLVYICTHNSRRSHFGQIWAHVAAGYYHIDGVQSYSGGTESTSFHVNAIHALTRIGFNVSAEKISANTDYKVTFDDASVPIICFSKVYDHPSNPQKNFAAIMTCGEAEQNCPFIPDLELRLACTYEDPKAFDHTELCEIKYDERCKQIARETFYVFSLVK